MKEKLQTTLANNGSISFFFQDLKYPFLRIERDGIYITGTMESSASLKGILISTSETI